MNHNLLTITAQPHYTISTMNRLSLLQLQFILLIICTSLLTLSSSTKHTFTTKNDPRHIIGPIGIPFGFLNGGVYNVTVFDFELTLGRKSKHSENQGQSTLKYVEAGFLLKRFDSESEFSKYHETIMEQPSICVFESHRSEDYVSVDASNIDDDMLEEDDKFEVVYDNHHDNMNHHTSNVKTGGVFLSMNQPENSWKPHKATVTYSFTNKEDEGLYFLIYQLCPRDNQQKMGSNYVHSSFELDLHFKNYDNYGNPSYLTAGEMKLPAMYLYFSMSYALCFFLWAMNIRNIRSGKEAIWAPKDGNSATSRPSVHAIHHLMTILLAMKTVTVLFESIRYHQIKIHGHAAFISAVYFVSFVKGIFMFTVILLIGSGWSLVKTSLGDKEKKLIWIVLVLQVIDNIAVAVLSQETLGERTYEDWKGLLHFVDILCCCAILVPIVWQVNSLESIVESDTSNATGEEDENKSSSVITNVESEAPPTAHAAHTLTKLKQFQRFYVLVVAYIYFTRIIVYLFANFLGYKSTWLQYLATELGTLVFYAIVGVLFKPEEDNPYLQVSEDTKRPTETEIEFTST